MGVGNYPYFIMAVIYIPEWDFSCEQFALTDNNTDWLVWLNNGGLSRYYYKKNNLVCIAGLAINFLAERWSQLFTLICQGINSTKTEQDRKDATWIVWRDVDYPRTTDGNAWITDISLPEYPNMQFLINRGFGGINGNFVNRVVREPLITVDFDGSGWTEEILRDVLRRINFAPGRPAPGVDPYSPGGSSDTGGGGGNHDDTSDTVPVSPMPTISATDTNFITLYNPSITQLRMLATWMWDSSLFDVNSFQKLFQSPMQAILGLSIVPVQPVRADTPTNIKIGNITSDVSAYPVTTQYKNVPLGSVAVEEYWGSYLDYAPYTKVEIYLPYIGTRELNADDVMGKTISVVYHVDVLSGSCVAQVAVNDSVMYQFSGNCATSVPITGNDWTNVINGAISVAVSGAMLATGMATGTAPVMATSAVSTVGSLAQNVTTMKPTVLKSGSISGSSGVLAVQTPYLIITRPRQAVPENQNKYTGYPAYITMQLGNAVGMTYVADCHLENIPCTDGELQEIERLLKEGVIL